MDDRVKKIIQVLGKRYPRPRPFLHFRTPFESLIATILSAQCTDERVNRVTPSLFAIANTPEKIIALGDKKLLSYIKSTGFFNTKTKNIMATSRMLVEKYNCRVPESREELQKLPGVGRKTASVVLSQAFGIPAFPVDRHVERVANRLALTHAHSADKTAEQLEKNIPRKLWIPLHLQLISLGREICRPRPKCTMCPLLTHCPEGQKRKKRREIPFNT